MACRACEQAVVQAPAPERLIKSGLPTEAMVAYVLAAKYAWHLPLYRQAQMLLSQGIAIERATLAFWVGYAAAELKPLYLRLRELIVGSAKIAVDETVAPVLDPGRGRTKKGYFWAIARDDRAVGRNRSARRRLHLCTGPRRRPRAEAARDLSRHRAMRRICGLQEHCRRTRISASHHARLLLGTSAKTSSSTSRRAAPRRSRAKPSMRIAALYAIEKTIRGRAADERRAVRQEKSKPLVLALKTWLEEQLARVSGKSVIAEAIRYGLNHWDGLTRFLEDGRIEIDTNAVERGIRPIAMTESLYTSSSSICKH